LSSVEVVETLVLLGIAVCRFCDGSGVSLNCECVVASFERFVALYEWTWGIVSYTLSYLRAHSVLCGGVRSQRTAGSDER